MMLLKLLRVKQWIKNGFVAAPFFFSYMFLNPETYFSVITATGAFCLISSAVYVLNDINDREKDQNHPKKRFRPIAAGQIDILPAFLIAILLVIGSISLSAFTNMGVTTVITVYFLMNILYTKVLKKIVLLDVGFIAIGFFLRLLAGALAIDVSLSAWIVLTTFFLSLLLGFSKRKNEFVSTDASHRSTLKVYTEELLNSLVVMSTTLTLLTYALYIIDTKDVSNLKYLANYPIVVYALFRYLYLLFAKNDGGDAAETLLKDKPLLVSAILWGIVMVLTFY